jgi:hypothetical protein
MMRRGFVAAMVGVTAALLVGLSATSIAGDIGGATGPAIQTMGISLAGIVGVMLSAATLFVLGKRRTFGVALYGGGTLLGVLFLFWASGRVPARPTLVLSASDRGDLREYQDALGVHGIEHPTLGFRLPHPTLALSPSTDIGDEMRAAAAPGWAEAHQIWAFETRDHGVSVVIDLSRAAHADRAALEAFDRAITGPLATNGNTVEHAELVGDPGCLRQPFTGHLANGGQVDGALFVMDHGTRSLRLVVTVVSDGTGDWQRWIGDVTLACERLR